MRILMFLLFPFSLAAQNKKDNVIIVNHFVSYNQIKEHLFNNGYGVTNTDTSFITTTEKSNGGIQNYSYLIKRSDTSVIFKGYFSGQISGIKIGNTPAEYTSGVAKDIFKEMDKIAKSFGYAIIYSKQ